MLREREEVTKDMASNYQQQQHRKSQRWRKEAREIFHVMGQILLYIFYVLLTTFAHILSLISHPESKELIDATQRSQIYSVMCHYQ